MLSVTGRSLLYGATWILAVGALVGYLVQEPERLSVLLSTPLRLLLELTFLVVITWTIVYLQSYATLSAIGKPPPFLEYMGVFFIGLLINYTPARVGIAARAYYLVKRNNVNIAVFSALSLFRLLVFILCSSLVAMIAFFLAIDDWRILNLLLLSTFVVCVSLPLVILASIRFGYWRHFPKVLADRVRDFGESFSCLSRNNRTIALLVLLMVFQFAFVSIRMWICFEYAGIDIDFISLMVFAPLGSILSVVAITPGGIGVREYVVATAAVSLGYPFEQGMQALLIDRICMIVAAVMLGGVSTLFVDFFPAPTRDEK